MRIMKITKMMKMMTRRRRRRRRGRVETTTGRVTRTPWKALAHGGSRGRLPGAKQQSMLIRVVACCAIRKWRLGSHA